MKTMMAVFAVSFAAALVVGASTPASARTPAGDTAACPPSTYDCCDNTIGTKEFCATHGGRCGVETICGMGV
jgi:hypothetical protein